MQAKILHIVPLSYVYCVPHDTNQACESNEWWNNVEFKRIALTPWFSVSQGVPGSVGSWGSVFSSDARWRQLLLGLSSAHPPPSSSTLNTELHTPSSGGVEELVAGCVKELVAASEVSGDDGGQGGGGWWSSWFWVDPLPSTFWSKPGSGGASMEWFPNL